MRVRRMATAMVTGCTVIVMSSVPGLAVQTPQEHQHPAADNAKPTSGMDARCHAMMAERDTMMTDMKTADRRLDALVVTMNTVSGMQQMAATTAVVTEMVAQRRTMRDGMMKMQDRMMGHMMEHMQAGTGSMAMCPMMKQLGA